MTRYRYNTQVQPPAPFVHVTLQNPADGTELRDVPAQLDTGADRTVLPGSVVEALHLPQMGTLNIAGLGGLIHSLPTFAIMLTVRAQMAQPIKVVGTADEPWILLGRDVLNAHQWLLDGPNLALEIG